MIILLQRVLEASVIINDKTIARIDSGLLAFVGFDKRDRKELCEKAVERILCYRIFEDEQGRMNYSIKDQAGHLLIVPQVTLAIDTRKGQRPSMSTAAPPALAAALFERLKTIARDKLKRVEFGQFGANMSVSLVNNGPATFILRVPPSPGTLPQC